MTGRLTDSARDDEPSGQGVLRRILAARQQADRALGKPPQLRRPAPASPSRLAATVLSRVAERLYSLPVQPLAVEAGAITLAEIPEFLPERPVVLLLQGQGDNLGAISFCPQAVAALVEAQTLGRVTARPLEARRPTRSEAMLCIDFTDALLAELQVELAGLDGFEGLGRFRPASSLDDPRPLALLLEDRPYRSLSFQLCFGSAETREGSVLVMLPEPPARLGVPRASVPAGQVGTAAPPIAAPTAAEAPPIDGPAAALPPLPGAAVPDMPIEVQGILCRRQVSLGELRRLAEGTLLHLPRVRLSEARLETVQGQLLASGKFGEAEGCHAIRLGTSDLAVEPAADDGPGTAVSAAPTVAFATLPAVAAQGQGAGGDDVIQRAEARADGAAMLPSERAAG